jgi:hypothetical protein
MPKAKTPNDPDEVIEQGPKGDHGKFIKTWLQEINDALKREKRYRELAKKVVDLYEAREPEQTPFSILYSNTETLVPAIYNSLPIPIVERKFRDPDPVGKSVSEVSTRTLKFLLSNDSKDYDGFDDLCQAAVLDGVITNRGLMRFRYHGDQQTYEECVYGESVRWDKFFHGYARTWKKVPWIGFEWDMSRDELKKNFPKAKFNDLRMTVQDDSADDKETNTGESKEELTGVRTYKVFEIWDKTSGKVFFISPLAPDNILRYIDDPLGLSGFFPVPKPLNFMRKVTTLVPTPLYEHYKQQAAELNELTRRLKAIIKAIKFRGAYNNAVEGIEKMLNADDNELVPVENVLSMPDGTGIDKLLWVVPVQELAVTAQQLYTQREQVKQVIYEITGIADIMRGATMASETATAQQIKNQWGTLRLKKMQREVQRFCRDALVIMMEIATKFEMKTFQQMTGLNYMTDEQKQQAQMLLQQFQAAQQQAQQTGQPPPQAPPIPPEIQQAFNLPTWEQVMEVIKNRLIFNYKIDIETNSTIDAEAAQDKQDIAELLNALSQFLNGIGPLVQEGVMPIEVAKQMLLTVARRFNFGSQLEDAINAMQQPQPKADPNEQVKVAAENAKAQTESVKAQAEQMKTNQEMQLNQQEFEHKQALMSMEYNMKIAEAQAKKDAAALQSQNLTQKAFMSAVEHKQRLEMMKAQAASTQDDET